jgi:hypothetical protein
MQATRPSGVDQARRSPSDHQLQNSPLLVKAGLPVALRCGQVGCPLTEALGRGDRRLRSPASCADRGTVLNRATARRPGPSATTTAVRNRPVIAGSTALEGHGRDDRPQRRSAFPVPCSRGHVAACRGASSDNPRFPGRRQHRPAKRMSPVRGPGILWGLPRPTVGLLR